METQRSGFTLVEVLAVVAVLAILMAIVIPQFTSKEAYREKLEGYSKVVDYMRNNHCEEIDYFKDFGTIRLMKKDGIYMNSFDLKEDCFVRLSGELEDGELKGQGTWTFKENGRIPGNWSGTRNPEELAEYDEGN